jgi:endonuclease V-like protein UPF0215 family
MGHGPTLAPRGDVLVTRIRRRKFSHVIAFDDAPFARTHRGDVRIVGVVFAGPRLDGVVSGRVRKDGANAARVIGAIVSGCRFAAHLQLIMLQGIAVAGFNVVDVFALHRATGLPVLVVARHEPDLDAIRSALLTRVPGGARKWRIIERLGAMERCEGVYVQRVGLTPDDARAIVGRFAINGHVPEPVRVAHLVASGIVGRA